MQHCIGEEWRIKKFLRDCTITIGLFFLSMLFCSGMTALFPKDSSFAVSIFILCVALIARFTSGYGYGILASVAGVLCVNTLYTYPYGEFNLSIAGYPLTFSAMLVVAMLISTLTTRIKKQEQQKLDVEKEKTRANLLRSVSHDLRTPLTSIMGAADAMLSNADMPPSEQKELLQEINRQAQWLTRVTENILSVTKFSDGEVQLRKEDEVVEEIVSGAIVKFRRQSDSLPVYVQRPLEILVAPMDSTLIEQVLINLFENAVIHGEHATRIDVSITSDEKYVQLCVKDDGCGIPNAILPKVLEGTAHVSQPQSDGRRRSMGIGLNVCRSIILAHGGDIRMENNRGGGAKITFMLPKGENTIEAE